MKRKPKLKILIDGVSAEFRQKILWRRWKFQFTSDMPPDVDGLCDLNLDGRPRVDKTVRVRSGLEGEYFLDCVCHEFLHAAFPFLNEEHVEQAATDLAQLICRREVLEPLLSCWGVQKIARAVIGQWERDLITMKPHTPALAMDLTEGGGEADDATAEA